MVTATRKLIKVSLIESVINKPDISAKEKIKMIDKNIHLPPKRKPKAPPPPIGGINIRQASIKYKINSVTILKWVQKKIVPTIETVDKCTYIDEDTIIKMSKMNPTERHRYVESFSKK